MTIARLVPALLALLTALGTASAGQNADPPNGPAEWPARTERLVEQHVVQADGSDVATFTFASRLLQESALAGFKQAVVSHSRSAQSLEILEAYTLKPDGRRLDAPKDNYQVREDSGRDQANPVFSDQSRTTVVFPEVAVGDRVVMSYRLTTKEPLFPGKLSLAGTYPKSVPFDDVRVVIDAPEGLHSTHSARGMKESVTTRNGRTVIEWTLRNPNAVRSQRVDFSVFDVESEPGFLFSTFDSYADIARSYVERAAPKAQPTERIRRLADQLTQGKASPREQVQALYEWVTTTITYAGNCVGIGAVVPRDLDIVLDNRMGDCKDHATLLQALLAAKGIASEQALVNAGNVYKLPSVPVASMVNHVINHVPSLQLFLDSTDPTMPFGMLPLQVQDKPVLMASGGAPLRTPTSQGVNNTQTMKTWLTIGDDGSAQGRVQVSLSGLFGIAARQQFKQVPKDQEAAVVKAVFREAGLEAEGTLDRGDTSALSDRYAYETEFKVRNLIPYPGSGAFQIVPLFYSQAPVAHFAQQAVQPLGEVDGLCTSASSSEEFEITLPAAMQLLSLPDGLAFNTPLISFEASYKLEGRVLRVQRRLEDRSPGNVCSAETMRQFKASLEPVMKHLRQQVLYK